MILAPLSAWADMESSKETFDWNPVMDAIIQVESKGDPKAVSGIYAGVLQIAPILVKDCNDILKRRGETKRYALSDRFNERKSREMFIIIQSYYNPKNNVERAIRLWNGGVGYSVAKTQRYFNKVMNHLR